MAESRTPDTKPDKVVDLAAEIEQLRTQLTEINNKLTVLNDAVTKLPENSIPQSLAEQIQTATDDMKIIEGELNELAKNSEMTEEEKKEALANIKGFIVTLTGNVQGIISDFEPAPEEPAIKQKEFTPEIARIIEAVIGVTTDNNQIKKIMKDFDSFLKTQHSLIQNYALRAKQLYGPNSDAEARVMQDDLTKMIGQLKFLKTDPNIQNNKKATVYKNKIDDLLEDIGKILVGPLSDNKRAEARSVISYAADEVKVFAGGNDGLKAARDWVISKLNIENEESEATTPDDIEKSTSPGEMVSSRTGQQIPRTTKDFLTSKETRASIMEYKNSRFASIAYENEKQEVVTALYASAAQQGTQTVYIFPSAAILPNDDALKWAQTFIDDHIKMHGGNNVEINLQGNFKPFGEVYVQAAKLYAAYLREYEDKNVVIHNHTSFYPPEVPDNSNKVKVFANYFAKNPNGIFREHGEQAKKQAEILGGVKKMKDIKSSVMPKDVNVNRTYRGGGEGKKERIPKEEMFPEEALKRTKKEELKQPETGVDTEPNKKPPALKEGSVLKAEKKASGSEENVEVESPPRSKRP